ncbi:MAG: hypothetical protein H8E25_06535 [Planctomycetes bacterium]|nr:hypothetical protein [Planctomycetota bacterium]
MTTFMLTAFAFVVIVAAMSVGVWLSGKKLSGSCGGKTPDEADLLGECVCARKEADICASDDGNELVMLAELGNPKRKPHNHNQSVKLSAADSIEV